MHVSVVLQYALELLDSKKNGGRTVVLSESQGQVLDCSVWPDEYSQALVARFPQCKITHVAAQDPSTTGFYVYVSLEEGRLRLRRSDMALLAYMLVVGLRLWFSH